MSDDERAALLDDRLYSVAKLVSEGWTDKAIAAKCDIHVRTLRLRIDAIAYLIHADPSRNVRVQIAKWWVMNEGTQNAA